MLIKLLLRLILGYVRIEVEGYYIERFINICANNKILIWNLKREKNVKLYLSIGINEFRKLKKVAKNTNCKIKILKKRGIPFLLNKYKKRKIFFAFLIIILCLIFISSRYIWNIEINVENNLEIEDIMPIVEETGLNKGVLKSKVDTNKIINNLRLKREDISWVGIDIKGTNVKINIVKAKMSPEIIKNTDYCNIVASKSGKITKIIAQNGTQRVNIGDEVNKGDILIEGIMEGKYTSPRLVHSLGEVEANVKYQKSEEIFLNEEIYKETGKKENKYEIQINNKKIKLYKNNSKFEIYETKIEEKKLKISKNFYLPIIITKITNKEQIKEEKKLSKEEALNKGIEKLNKEMEEQLSPNVKIVEKKVNKEEKESSIIITLIYEINENIGIMQKIK